MLDIEFKFITDVETDYRPWYCLKCGIVIGRVVTSNKITKLNMIPERGIILLGDADIHCLNCGTIREWHYNEDTLNRLIDRVLVMRKH
jgi:hypothetical protein